MTIAVDLERKATKQTNKQTNFCLNIEHQEVMPAMYTVLMLRYVKMSVRRLLADHRHTKSNQHGIDVWLLKI